MDNKKNRLKEVLEGKNADTKRLKAELKALGIPPTTLWKYLNQPETDIKGSHVGIIMHVTGCTYDEVVVNNTSISDVNKKGEFNLSKQP